MSVDIEMTRDLTEESKSTYTVYTNFVPAQILRQSQFRAPQRITRFHGKRSIYDSTYFAASLERLNIKSGT